MKKNNYLLEETSRKKISLSFDAHWYRRVFHAFGASFLLYYYLPEEEWIIFLKFWIPPIIVVIAIILEILIIKGFMKIQAKPMILWCNNGWKKL